MIPFKTPKHNEIIHLNDGKKIVSSFTLKKYETDTRLAGFLRVHKSFLLNPAFIKHYEQRGKKATVHLSTGKVLVVSRRRMVLIKNQISLNMKQL
jgi:DNA-binding LytR/AlgR family response regulator